MAVPNSNFLEDLEKYGCFDGDKDYIKNLLNENLQPEKNPLKKPLDGHSFAPFVELRLFSKKFGVDILTVGNNSSPKNGNTAVIKSMEFGTSEGMGCVVEIFDEMGGSFERAFNALNKSLYDSTEDGTMNFVLDFGWIVERTGTVCGEKSTGFKKISVSDPKGDGKPGDGGFIRLNPISAKIVYEQGKIKYTIEANDAQSRIAEARVECAIGSDQKKVDLKQAIKDLFEKKEPGPQLKVQFLDSKGKSEFKFKVSDGNGGKDGTDKGNGPKGVWTTNQQNKLSAVRRWIAPLTTTNNKGLIMYWEGKNDGKDPKIGGTIIIQEDPGPDLCNPITDCKERNLGTYIINGGDLSPVLSFNPSVSWMFGANSKSGGAQSAVSGNYAKMEGNKDCPKGDKRGKGGTSTNSAPGGSQMHYRDPGSQAKETAISDAAHQAANSHMEGLSPIEAELRILGDPSYCFPINMKGKMLALVVINPFHVRKNTVQFDSNIKEVLNYTGPEADKPDLDVSFRSTGIDWLSTPKVNPIFSNKNWMINGISHQIREGQFSTTLKLILSAPGVDLQPDAKLGGGLEGPVFSMHNETDVNRCDKK
jgi:hypothetical protein